MSFGTRVLVRNILSRAADAARVHHAATLLAPCTHPGLLHTHFILTFGTRRFPFRNYIFPFQGRRGGISFPNARKHFPITVCVSIRRYFNLDGHTSGDILGTRLFLNCPAVRPPPQPRISITLDYWYGVVLGLGFRDFSGLMQNVLVS